MSETANHEWDSWQAAWRTTSAAQVRATPRTAELQRRLLRHRRAARIYTALDTGAAAALCALAAGVVMQGPTVPAIVWAISLVLFTGIVLAWAIWNRRDALVASADSTADFVAALRLRLERRERMPRFIVRFAMAEMAFGLAFYAIWSPGWIGRTARIYGMVAIVLGGWWAWYRRRLARERAQFEALCNDPASDPAASPSDRGDIPGS